MGIGIACPLGERGLFPVPQLESRTLLTRQLVEISSLAAQLRQSLDRPNAKRLYRELCNCATLHVLARERFVLPAWGRAHYNGLQIDALIPHAEFKRRLAELMVRKPHDPEFLTALTTFEQAVRSQQRADEELVLPALQAAVELDERRFLMNDIDRLYSLGAAANAPDDPDAARSGIGLLEDAEIVLSSLGGATVERKLSSSS